MERLIIQEEMRETPFVDFDFEKGVFLMRGYSMPSDPEPFYEQIIKKLKEFLEKPTETITLEMKMIYFNTASSKKILDLIILFPDGSLVKWYYDEGDEDMLDAGKDYSIMLDNDVQFEYIEVV